MIKKEGWKYEKLGDVCIIERGGSPRPIEKFITNEENGINWIKIGDAQEGTMIISSTKEKIKPEGMSKSRFVRKGDFILSNSMSFGKPYILGVDGCIHDGWLVIRDEKNVFDKNYLYHFLGCKHTYQTFKNMAVGGVVNNLNSKMVRGLVIPIPPLPIQHQIVAELDTLSNIITKKKQQLTELDNLAQATFYDMFGDPVSNEKGWEVKELSKLGIFKNGLNYKSSEDGLNVKILGVTDFKANITIKDTTNFVYVGLDKEPNKDYYLKDNDIVFVRSNGSKELVGRCVLLSSITEDITFSGFCIRFRLASNEIIPLFLIYILSNGQFRRNLIEQGRGCNISNVNQQMLSAQVIILPPIARQDIFSRKIESIEQQKNLINQSITEAQQLFDSTMDKYFNEA